MPFTSFDTDLVDLMIEMEGIVLPSETTGESVGRCRSCGAVIDDEIECPVCGAINLLWRRRRKNRPSRTLIREIDSENYNGRYKLWKNSDGSISCTCLSFLFQRGVQNGPGFATCKHIRSYLDEASEQIRNVSAEPPSEWQRAALRKLGVELSEHLTDAQAYFLFEDLLQKQGVHYREYEDLLLTHSRVNLLPIYSFGVELELNIRSREELKRKLEETGIPVMLTGYDHTLTTAWKIGTDGSLRRIPGYETCELVSPKLFGAEGFRTLKKVLSIVSEVGVKVNRSCGTHLHVDAWNWNTELMGELLKVWAKIEVPFVWYLVSPSRRNGWYSRMVDDNLIVKVLSGELHSSDRYHSLNVCAFERHKTVEFRIHNATANYRKLTAWIVFCLKLVDAVKKGLRHTDITDTSFSAVMDAIGMDSSATSVIKEARNYLYGRYQYWKEDAERNPDHVPQVTPVNLDEEHIERLVRQRRERTVRREIERLWTFNYEVRQTTLTSRDDSLPLNSVHNLASMQPSSVISRSVFDSGYEEGRWTVPCRGGNSTYEVVLDRDSDTLSCSCRIFRRTSHCWHTINAARYLVTRRQIEQIQRV